MIDPNLVVPPPAPWELAANRAPELAGGREVSDGLGIDL
jgi:hypothetical protein